MLEVGGGGGGGKPRWRAGEGHSMKLDRTALSTGICGQLAFLVPGR